MTSDQRSRINALIHEGQDYEDILDIAEDIVGRPVLNVDQLSQGECQELIEKLQDNL